MDDNTHDEHSNILKDRSKKSTLREKWKNREYRAKSIQSLGICASFLSLGANDGQIGPTLLDLQIITNTDLVKASSFISAVAAGYLSGTTVCGIIFGKAKPDLLIFLAVLIEGLTSMATPFCSYYELMLFIRFATFFSAGLLNTTANAMIMGLWGTDGDQWMHFLHFCFALGGVLSPLYTAPFLTQNQPEYDANMATYDSSMFNLTESFLRNNVGPLIQKETNVKYAFMISGLFSILMSLPLLAFFIINRKKIQQQKQQQTKCQRQMPKLSMVFTLFILGIFFMMYAFLEMAFIGFLLTFMVRQYPRVTKSKGSFAVTMFWTLFAIGRFFMVITSKVISPVKILAMSIGLMVVSFTGFVIMAENGIINALIVFSAAIGLSLSGLYAAALSWIEAEILKVTGFVAGIFIIFSSIASLIDPLIFGHLMQEFSNMWFCYLVLGASILFAFLFISILLYSRCYLNRRFGPCNSDLES